jgi:transposase InsO family protein
MPEAWTSLAAEPMPRLPHLNGDIFYSLKEVRIVTGWWRDHYNRLRPHSSLGYRPPAPETIMEMLIS